MQILRKHGKHKLFPLTAGFQKEFQKVTPSQAISFCQRFPKFLEAPFLFAVASAPADKSPAGIDVGFISYFNYCRIPPLVRKNYALPIEVLRNAETYTQWAPLYAIATDLSAMAAITPAVLSQIARRIQSQINEYWPYLEGRKPMPDGLPAINVSAERLRLLRQHLEGGSELSFKKIWPTLQFAACWKSSTCALQIPELERYVQKQFPIVDGIYSATEGWMTVPMNSDQPGGPLHMSGHVVEFLPTSAEVHARNLLKPWQLEAGKEYEVILTTSMGFVRYRLFDVVRCNGFFNRSPILEFRFKSGNMVSIGQSRFSESHLKVALDLAAFQCPGHWVFGSNTTANRFVLYVTARARPQLKSLREMITIIQKDLCRSNPEYQDDLKSGTLLDMEIVELDEKNPFWTAEGHAQSKPKIISRGVPT